MKLSSPIISILIKELWRGQGNHLWDPININRINNKGMLLGIPKNDCIWDFIQNIISFSYKITN
jgi:hypothetical protein